jgi:hypothetical protein
VQEFVALWYDDLLGDDTLLTPTGPVRVSCFILAVYFQLPEKEIKKSIVYLLP